MQVSDFNFTLPEELIAQQPLVQRSASRLLCLDKSTGELSHSLFSAVLDQLKEGDLLVFNNTRVIPARLYGRKATGGKIELLVERVLDEHQILAHIKASRAPKAGTMLILADKLQAEVTERRGDLFVVKFFEKRSVLDVLDECGSMPLPPYITRSADDEDSERYQTVYAKHAGAVAAPTAGLHFDEALLQQLKRRGVEFAFVTLHVGAGTFQPVRVEQIEAHVMHSEIMVLSETVCQQVRAAKQRGGRVIAVGTTSVRCLETAAQAGDIQPYSGETAIFIYPGYQFKVVDALLTNFHLPESTLLMLVAALASYDTVMHAYQEAIEQCYRFFSYGDAMFIH